LHLATFILNLLPSGPDDLTPRQWWDGTEVPVSALHIFGSDASIFDERANPHKLESKGIPGRFLGYFQGHFDKIQAWDIKNNCILTAGYGDVTFNETNVEALIPDLDANDEIQSLVGLIHSSVDLESAAQKEVNAAGTAAGGVTSQLLTLVPTATLPSSAGLPLLADSPSMVGLISTFTSTYL